MGKPYGTQPRKPWISQEMIDKMEERRQQKNVNTDEGRQKYKSVNNQLRRATDKAREKWLEEQCSELEQYGKQGRMYLTYRRVAELKSKRRRNTTRKLKIDKPVGEMVSSLLSGGRVVSHEMHLLPGF